MNALKKQAQQAGLLYLTSSVFAVYSWVYVSSKLIVTGDATATASRIRASETLFRIGIGSELIGLILFMFVVLALYRLFRPVSQTHAVAMAALLLMSLPISFASVINEIAALIVIKGAGFLSVFDQHQLDALAYLFLRLDSHGYVVAQIFWGLWLFPFGILVVRSGFIPRFLGYLLFVAGVGYIANSGAALFLPAYRHAISQVADRLQMAELPIILWLLIWGARSAACRSGTDGHGDAFTDYLTLR